METHVMVTVALARADGMGQLLRNRSLVFELSLRPPCRDLEEEKGTLLFLI